MDSSLRNLFHWPVFSFPLTRPSRPRLVGEESERENSEEQKIMKLCGFDIGLDKPIFLMAGPCVLEGELMALDIAHTMKEITSKLALKI